MLRNLRELSTVRRYLQELSSICGFLQRLSCIYRCLQELSCSFLCCLAALSHGHGRHLHLQRVFWTHGKHVWRDYLYALGLRMAQALSSCLICALPYEGCIICQAYQAPLQQVFH